MKIKDIPLENRPRERLEKNGPSVLSDSELLAVILQKGTAKDNAVDMSNKLLSKYPIEKLSEMTLIELQEIDGIGPAKAMQIVALFEFNKRHSFSKVEAKPIKTAKDVYDYCHPKLNGADKEHFMILHLNTRNRIIKDEIVSIGTLNSFIIHPREVFKSAIKESSNAIILVHNHPSGDTEPSEEDNEITKLLFKAGELLSIKVLDHVIIGNDKYYSYKDSQ